MGADRIVAIVTTLVLLVGGLVWALPSLRRLFLLAVTLGVGGAIKIGGTATGGIYPYELLIIVCWLMLMVNRFTSGRPGRSANPIWRNMFLLMAGFAGWVLLGSFTAVILDPPDLSLLAMVGTSTENVIIKLFAHVLISLMLMAAAFWAGGHLFDLRTDTQLVLSSVIYGSTLVAVPTLVAWWWESGGTIARYNFQPPTDLGQGGTSAMALIGLLCSVILLMNSTRADKQQLIVVFALAANLLTVVVIQSRQGYAAALLHLIVVVPLCANLAFKRRGRLLFTALVPILLIVGAAGISVLQSQTGAGELFSDLMSPTSLDRSNKEAVVRSGLDMFLAHPIAGVGWGQFVLHNTVPMVVSGEETYVATPHNGVIQLLCETGAIGAVLAYAMCFLLIKRLWRVYRGPYPTIARCLVATVFIMVCFATVNSVVQTHVMFPTPTQHEMVRMAFVYWFLAGFATGAGRYQPAAWADAAKSYARVQHSPDRVGYSKAWL